MIGRRRSGTRVLRSLLAAVVLLPLAATAVLAHPLGNFTINHHAGIRVEPDRLLLDVVIDQAEIPTFQAVMDLDEDGDGEFSDDELLAAETAGCTSVGEALSLTIDGAAAPLRVIEAGVTFPPGNGGLSTMRLVCTLESPLAAPITAPDNDRVRGPLRARPHRLARDDRHRQRHDDLRHRPPLEIADRPPDVLPHHPLRRPRHPHRHLHRDPGRPPSRRTSTSPTPTPSPPSNSVRRWW